MKTEYEDSRIIKYNEGSAELIPVFEVSITHVQYRVNFVSFLAFNFTLISFIVWCYFYLYFIFIAVSSSIQIYLFAIY